MKEMHVSADLSFVARSAPVILIPESARAGGGGVASDTGECATAMQAASTEAKTMMRAVVSNEGSKLRPSTSRPTSTDFDLTD